MIVVMGTLNAFYVRAEAEQVRPAVQREEVLSSESGMAFVQVLLPTNAFTVPAERLRDLSERLDTDVLWLTFQSVVDAFRYLHWQRGILMRELVYGCNEEGTWERVEGAEEVWEAEALWLTDNPDFVDARETARSVAEFYRLTGWCLGDLADD